MSEKLTQAQMDAKGLQVSEKRRALTERFPIQWPSPLQALVDEYHRHDPATCTQCQAEQEKKAA